MHQIKLPHPVATDELDEAYDTDIQQDNNWNRERGREVV